MKINWQIKKLGEVCDIVNGGTPKTNISEYWNGDILWVTPKDMGKMDSFFLTDTERKISEVGLKNSSAKIIPSNSVILSTRAPIGHLAINKNAVTTNQGCKGLIPNNNLNVYFLFYFLKLSVDFLNNLGSGTTFKELSGTKLKEVEISLPPLSEQQIIVSKLDSLLEQTKKLGNIYKQKLTNLEELKKSVLKKAFSGEL
ncbi:MAG: restriction endonuclease subunit S [Actinomycetia bacterium]|nr:restriction endonuclease subunit S [Actinomycetes bacterium]